MDEIFVQVLDQVLRDWLEHRINLALWPLIFRIILEGFTYLIRMRRRAHACQPCDHCSVLSVLFFFFPFRVSQIHIFTNFYTLFGCLLPLLFELMHLRECLASFDDFRRDFFERCKIGSRRIIYSEKIIRSKGWYSFIRGINAEIGGHPIGLLRRCRLIFI